MQTELTRQFIGAERTKAYQSGGSISQDQMGDTMNTYNVKLSYEDREKGDEGTTVKVEATTIAGAIAKAAREFVKSLDRKQRFDANKGLQIKAARLTAGVTEATETVNSKDA
jgi:hypothetical protein